MRMKTGLCALTALVLTGCQRGTSGNNSATPGNSVQSIALTREFMVGTWGIGGGCQITIAFNADGTAGPPEGSRWVLEGNTVTVTQPGGQPLPAVVTIGGPDAFTATPPGGAARTFNRCPA